MGQLPLALALPRHARFETFVPGANRAVVEHARAVASGAPDVLWISGPVASGKTHLLQAACREAASAARRAMYVPLSEHALEPAILAGLESVELLALDDIDRAAGDPAWERQLFVLLNELAARRGGLLLADALQTQVPFEAFVKFAAHHPMTLIFGCFVTLLMGLLAIGDV